MKNIYYLTRVFKDDSLGVSDEQLLSKIKMLRKSNADWTQWTKEVSNPNISNDEAVMVVLASKNPSTHTNLQIMKAYIQRSDTSFVKSIELMVRTKQLSLWKMIPITMKQKAESSLEGKDAEQKLELARVLKIVPFWNIVIKENDVQKFILTLPAEKAVSYPEEMGYNGLWNLTLQNPNVSKLMTA